MTKSGPLRSLSRSEVPCYCALNSAARHNSSQGKRRAVRMTCKVCESSPYSFYPMVLGDGLGVRGCGAIAGSDSELGAFLCCGVLSVRISALAPERAERGDACGFPGG